MRRKEFSIAERQEIDTFLAEMSCGFLGTIGEDGWPRVTPLNFVHTDDAVYFHGSKIGEKMEHLRLHPNVTFAVAKEYAIIPSYFSDPKLACPATSYFKSVLFKGTAQAVDDLAEKARSLTAFMEKLQPEGGYEPIDPDDADYAKQLRGVAVVKICVESVSAKFKFGQNMKEPRFDKVVAGLEQRQEPLDAATIELMKRYCPHHK
ncbi:MULTISPECIES: pyridoxamine 5'-phosphate oxidase family protein [unclassified Paenibacillus]|uniref:pyridoxamine 5'-phosphate oxidase family protein n=1 Tax=unclassified Paenibacillus TaxID=185978 RepID=UPI001C0F538A|nr:MULTISPECIES: pyridoxamine 5'-phosphate oxidase family protein [unclassified Paenibacillus]MBU5440855.1 pyridoxamine 5'-phosphate oxidase family protein [Paenibacillus sp. MSJ-34]CAH0118446.1 hypothetical protein PAE9249_00934 [Paenibacillus sp. CECT 9249]